ncbi:hypothetical protein Tco_1546801 [Tanacetum coccineum]
MSKNFWHEHQGIRKANFETQILKDFIEFLNLVVSFLTTSFIISSEGKWDIVAFWLGLDGLTGSFAEGSVIGSLIDNRDKAGWDVFGAFSSGGLNNMEVIELDLDEPGLVSGVELKFSRFVVTFLIIS